MHFYVTQPVCISWVSNKFGTLCFVFYFFKIKAQYSLQLSINQRKQSLTCSIISFFFFFGQLFSRVLTTARCQVGFSFSHQRSRKKNKEIKKKRKAQQLPWQHGGGAEEIATVSFLTSLPPTHRLTPTSSPTPEDHSLPTQEVLTKRSDKIQKNIPNESSKDLPRTPSSCFKWFTQRHAAFHPAHSSSVPPHIPAHTTPLSRRELCIVWRQALNQIKTRHDQ